jgi:hypothetical protein
MTRNKFPHAFGLLAMWSAILPGIALVSSIAAQNLADTLQYGTQRQADRRSEAIKTYSPNLRFDSPPIGSMSANGTSAFEVSRLANVCGKPLRQQ